MPGVMCAFGVFLLVRLSTQTAKFANAPLERRIAVWKDERTEVRGGSKHSSASTTHYVLLDFQRVDA